MKNDCKPYLGYGLGLRPLHYQAALSQPLAIDWFEVLTENYLVPGGKPLYFLDKICEKYPTALHGVSLSIGSVDPIDWEYLRHVKQLAQRTNAQWISDHLCWTGVKGQNTHDLLPLPYTEECLKHVKQRLDVIQDFFGQALVLENVSSYLTFPESTMHEFEFIRELQKVSHCLLLLDVNNVIVSAHNHHYDAKHFIASLPTNAIQQLHLAGHTHAAHLKIDTHDQAIPSEVWDLYAYTLKTHGILSTSIERDDNIPPIEELVAELTYAREIGNTILRTDAA